MTKIILNGCSGKMGNMITQCAAARDTVEIVAGVDLIEYPALPYPIFANFSELNVAADLVLDFSHPSALPSVLAYAVKKNIPAVIATTGIGDEQMPQIEAAAEKIPVFFSANMSIGISLLCELSKIAARILGEDFDIEIVEAHHNQKLDAPSGTALMLANAVKSVYEDKELEYDRHLKRERRDQKEIGIHSIRGGTIVGEHEVIFAGHDEIVTLSHSARSKAVFAEGALNAGLFLVGKKPSLYTMKDIVRQ